MKLIYLCCPYSGNIKKNIKNALIYSKYIYAMGNLPICVHCFLESVTGLNEKNGDRKRLLDMGIEYLKKCDEMWVIENRLGITEGMEKEIKYARKNNIETKWIVEQW